MTTKAQVKILIIKKINQAKILKDLMKMKMMHVNITKALLIH